MELLFYICAIGSLVFGAAAFFVWAIWVHHYVEVHGEKPAFFLYNMASFLDYRTACRISDRTGRKPRFLVWYDRLLITDVVFLICGVVAALVWQLRG